LVKSAIHWLQTNSIILLNSSSLVGATLITSGLGFVYWWLAARWFPPEAIGVASASVSAVMLLSSASILGLGTLLITELPRQPEKAGSLMSTALLVVGIAGCVTGCIFALVASSASPGFRPLGDSAIDVGTFSVGVGFSAMTLVLDQALIGLLKGGLQFWRNVFFALIKLVALLVVNFWPSQQVGMKIYATWMVSAGLSLGLIVLNIVLNRRWRRKNYWPQWQLLRKLGLAAVQHHMLNLTLQAPTQLLPVLVTFLLSARMNAWFYVAWMIASFIFIVPGALTTVLHATNAAQQTTLARKARLTIGVALVIALAANLVLQIGTTQVLGIFGATYASQASWCLRILLLAAFPLTIKNHYISICRIQDRIVKAMVAMLPGGLLELGAATLGAQFAGLSGLSLGWVLAICVEAAFMLPTVYTAVRLVPHTDIREQTTDHEQESHPLETQPLSSPGTLEALWLIETLILPIMPFTRKNDSVSTDVEKKTTLKTDKHHSHLKPLRLQLYNPSQEEREPTKADIGPSPLIHDPD
jgi:O-antigen/teichoic acid export membrane protein